MRKACYDCRHRRADGRGQCVLAHGLEGRRQPRYRPEPRRPDHVPPSIYQQVDTNAVIRRNLFMDPSATGCSCRGDTSIQENVFIDNPLSIIAGSGDNYNT